MKKGEEEKITLLCEWGLDFIVESHDIVTLDEANTVGGDKKEQTFLKLTGTFQKGNSPNGNKRIYKTELLERELGRIQSRLSRGLALGKAYHPGFFDPGGPSGVTDISHRITKLWMEGDVVKGELLVFRTTSGKDIEAITDGGGKIGISSRGYGSSKFYNKAKVAGVEYKDVFIIDDNYRLETFDLVLNPSVKTAIMFPVKETINNNKVSNDKVDEALKSDKSICKKDNSRGGNKSMTIEELKSLHPELYNNVRDAAIKEGKELTLKDVKATNEAAIISVNEEKASEIKVLKEANETLTSDNVSLKKENEELKVDKAKVEADKLAVDIKVAVTDAINSSDYKKYFKEEDIVNICQVVESTDTAKKEVEARIGVIKNVIGISKSTNTVVESNSAHIDTSEVGSSDSTDKEKNVKAFNEEQRVQAMDGLF